MDRLHARPKELHTYYITSAVPGSHLMYRKSRQSAFHSLRLACAEILFFSKATTNWRACMWMDADWLCFSIWL